MTGIEIRLPWGRYYAHAWGMNPGRLREAEWPPSPWRLLRALASAWFRSHPGQAADPAWSELLETLGGTPPEIGIGKASFSYTVHYQPNFEKDKHKGDARYGRSRHENHFVATDAPILFRWPDILLNPTQSTLLDNALAGMSYFGRSESICDARQITAAEMRQLRPIAWCKPTGKRTISESCRDVTCARPGEFRAPHLWSARGGTDDGAHSHPHLVDQMLATDMQADGAATISYQMPQDWPAKRVIRLARSTRQPRPDMDQGSPTLHYLRFSLQCRAPIPPRFTVPIAEQFRLAASRNFRELCGPTKQSFALFGHPEHKPPGLTLEHQHAFYLPTGKLTRATPPDAQNMIEDFHVWCPYGLTASEAKALLRIDRIDLPGNRYPIRAVPVEMAPEIPPDVFLAPRAAASRRWRSATPFVPPRHFYRRKGADQAPRPAEAPELQLARCLLQSGVTARGEIRRLAIAGERPTQLKTIPPQPLWAPITCRNTRPAPLTGQIAPATHTHPQGNNGGPSRQRIGFFLEINFDTKVALPIPALGASNHFGLGIFVPALA